MRRRRIQIHLSILAIIASIAGSALASSTATITGRVTDSQGGILVGVKVEATNVETNLTSAGATNSEGLYVISNLPPGRYRMTIQKQGFQTIVKPDVVLHVQDVVGINFSMQIGSITQSITVEGGAPLVQTGSAEVSQVIQKAEIDTL
ncbi:MAG: carboxypeptidase-like regulatory domain-containing protein, partial [Blastocatellia bacterium]